MNSEPASAERNDGADLEKLLDLADRFRESVERMSGYVERYTMYEYMAGFAAAFFLGALGLAVLGRGELGSPRSPSLAFLAFTSGMLFSLLNMVAFQASIRRWRRRMKPDLFALNELVVLIRETEASVASSERWSPLKRAEFRIRLSRFEIGVEQPDRASFGKQIMPPPHSSRADETGSTKPEGASLRTS
ncbi:MAG TPA: hypothetical protein VI756_25415 [Blastocatellia bacterium]